MTRLPLLLSLALLTAPLLLSRMERFAGAGPALFVDQTERFNAVVDAFLEPFGVRE